MPHRVRPRRIEAISCPQAGGPPDVGASDSGAPDVSMAAGRISRPYGTVRAATTGTRPVPCELRWRAWSRTGEWLLAARVAGI